MALSQYKVRAQDLLALFEKLDRQGYTNIGPKARDGAIMMEPLSSFDDLASGYYEDQGKGSYYLDHMGDRSLFRYTVGPQSIKKYLHPSRRLLWSATRTENGFDLRQPAGPPKMAFWGIRNCDLEAIRILDRVFLQGHVVNEWYQQARSHMFMIAAACTHPSTNCFCTSMEGGPRPEDTFDISLLEVLRDDEHYFIADVATERALHLAESLQYTIASREDIRLAEEAMRQAEGHQHVRMPVEEARELLRTNLEHKQWDDVANRCLSCANCTMVCPTCFCTTTEDLLDLTGDHTERWLRQDSCFTGAYSYIHGGTVRSTTKSRYRQWVTHKFLHWHYQFGTAGCVGCGRCIAWCPVGIDITEEISRMKKQTEPKEEAYEIDL